MSKASQHIDGLTPRVYWLTGLSGSGKSTLAEYLEMWLRERGQTPVMLDGDAIRDLVLEPSAHDRESRLRVARFNARLCRFLVTQGQTVICPTISLFHDVQRWNRENIPGYVEIFIDVPLDVIRRRDPKGLYSAYDQGKMRDVVGLDIPAEFPQKPDITLEVSEEMSATYCAERLHRFIESL